jgi:hypothetical protein
MVNCKWCNKRFTWIEDCKLHEKYCAANTKVASLHIAQQTKAKIRPCAALGCRDYYLNTCEPKYCKRYQPLA